MGSEFQQLLEWLITRARCEPKQIAAAADIHPTAVSRWRSGETKPDADHFEAVQGFYRRMLARVAIMCPAILPSSAFKYVCSHASDYAPGHGKQASMLLDAVLSRIQPDYALTAGPERIVDFDARGCSVSILPADLDGKAEAHIFRADCGEANAFVILFDQKLRGSELLPILATELGHLLDQLELPRLPDRRADSFVAQIRQSPPSQRELAPLRCGRCLNPVSETWTFCPSCGNEVDHD